MNKKFEFRKSLPKRGNVTTVVVYSTIPIGKVVGEFKPKLLWDKIKDFSGITKDFFNKYFSTQSLAHAFEIDAFELYKEPKHISEIISSGIPPQSYRYLE